MNNQYPAFPVERGLKSRANLALLRHIEDQQPCNRAELLDVLNKVVPSTFHGLGRRLSRLHVAGYIHSRNQGAGELWSLGPAVEEEPPIVNANVATPRQVDLMHGPVYTPPPPTEPRAGSLDYKRCPSRGVRC